MPLLVIKTNPSHVTDVLIEDVGVIIPASGGQESFSDREAIRQLQSSEDLITYITDQAYGVAEVTSVTTVADVSGSLDGTYFLLDSPSTSYYVWMNVDAGGNDPGPISGRTGVAVAITSNDADTAVASALASALDALADFSAVASGNVVTITNASVGAVTDAMDVSTGFTISVTTQGVDGSTLLLNDGTNDIAYADTLSFLDHVLIEGAGGAYHVLKANSSGELDAAGTSIVGVAAPTAGDHVANKQYVDSLVGGSAKRWLAFNSERRVPASLGIRYLEVGGVSTAAAPLVMPRPGTITAATISVNRADAANSYKLAIYKNGTEVESVPLTSGNVKTAATSFTTTYNTLDEIAVLVERTSGSTHSNFDEITAMVEFQDA